MATIKNQTSEKLYALMGVPSLYSVRNSVSDKQKGNYAEYDTKMLAIEKGYVGSISDCFILYAIAKLQYASREVILEFLATLSKKNPSYYIPELDYKGLNNRIKELIKYGFIIALDNEVSVEGLQKSHLILYAVTEDGRTLANNRLQKRVKPDRFGNTRPLCEKVGMGASAYLVTKLMSEAAFVDFADGVFKGKYCGTIKLDNEIYCEKDNQKEHIAVISFFAHQNMGYMNEKAFEDYKFVKLNTIRDYLITKSQKDNHSGKVICLCEDQKDFEEITEFIYKSRGSFDEWHINSIYFTTQSAVASVKNVKDAFMQMSIDSNDELVYHAGCDFL